MIFGAAGQDRAVGAFVELWITYHILCITMQLIYFQMITLWIASIFGRVFHTLV